MKIASFLFLFLKFNIKANVLLLHSVESANLIYD